MSPVRLTTAWSATRRIAGQFGCQIASSWLLVVRAAWLMRVVRLVLRLHWPPCLFRPNWHTIAPAQAAQTHPRAVPRAIAEPPAFILHSSFSWSHFCFHNLGTFEPNKTAQTNGSTGLPVKLSLSLAVADLSVRQTLKATQFARVCCQCCFCVCLSFRDGRC